MIGSRKEIEPWKSIYFFLNCNKTYSNWQLAICTEKCRQATYIYLIVSLTKYVSLLRSMVGVFALATSLDNNNANLLKNTIPLVVPLPGGGGLYLWSQTMICVRFARITRCTGHCYWFTASPLLLFFFISFDICDASTNASILRLNYVLRFRFTKDKMIEKSKITRFAVLWWVVGIT